MSVAVVAVVAVNARIYSHVHFARSLPPRRYYDSGLSSVYLWDLDDGAFAGVVLFKKGGCPACARVQGCMYARLDHSS